jgi:hypothetical protein
MKRIVLIAVLVPACEQVKKVDGDGGGACVPAEVQAAFDRSCSGGTCHVNAGSPGAGLSLAAGDSEAAVGRTASTGTMPLIELGNTGNSYVAQKMLANPTTPIMGSRMPDPFTGSAEQVEDVNTILTWIGGGVFECEGADTSGSGSESGTTGDVPLRACGLQDLAPGTPSTIVSGTGAGQIPPDIATILEGNCGCHYTNTYPEPPPYIDYQEGTAPFDMTTIAGFQADAAGQPYHALTLSRVMGGGAIAMPPPDPYCQAMSPSDTDTLVAWLTAGAPDGATWMPGPGASHVCGIEDLKPGAPNPIMTGMGAGQIPPDIGEILANNCGCHYADDLTAPGFDSVDYGGTADLATHAGWQAGMLYATALDYVATEFMPLTDMCEQDDGNKLSEDDYRTLTKWLSQGAPDGATWQP